MITLQKNTNQDYFLFFDVDKKNGLKCISSSYEQQVNFLIACLEKFKQVSLISTSEEPEKIEKLKKHYLKKSEIISIQKSYLKFLRENLLKNQANKLTFVQVFNTLP